MVLCESQIYFLASKKKIEFLKPIQDGQKKTENIPPVTLLLRNKVRSKSYTIENLHKKF